MSPAHSPIRGIHTHVCVCGIPQHFQNTQSFEHDNNVLAFHNGAARATRLTSTPCCCCCCCGFCSFREKQTRPSGQEFTLCQRTRSSRPILESQTVPTGRRKGVLATTSSATVQNPSKFYTQVSVASLRLSPQQMFTLSGVALVLDCLLCWAST